DLIHLLINMQIINGLVAPVILIFILTLANRRSVLGTAVNGPRFNIVATVSVVAVAALALVAALVAVNAALGG
ncbi:MAG TPA: hypothetical protein VGH94_05470, partial [Acidimicrobiales bacterium]